MGKTVEPILPECQIDTVLVETIVPPTTRYNHQSGCQSVATAMQNNYSDDFALGIIDRDKKKIIYLNEFVLEIEVTGEIILWKHPAKHHYIIQICPAIESWILKRSVEMQLDLSAFNLPQDLKELCAITKTIVSQKDARFRALFNAMKSSDNEVMSTLINWISHLKEKKFKADLQSLK